MVVGDPAPQGSKKSVGNGRFIESSKRLKPWRARVADSAFQAFSQSGLPQFDKPVIVGVVFLLKRPASVTPAKRAWPVSQRDGDTDKLQRGLGDALSVDSGVLADDSLIVEWEQPAKIYADGFESGAVITIREATDADLERIRHKVVSIFSKVTK